MDIIIGAGISGLSYANFNKKGDYVIFEKESEAGGYCRTIKKDGFIWDYSGHFFHFQNNEIKQYLLEKIPNDLLVDVNKQTQIFFKEKYIDFPFQKNIHQLSKEDFIECLYDLFNNNHTQNDSFKQMLYTKFGKSISDFFLIPYNEKLYACDLNELDVDAMGRFFPYADKEDIIKNFKRNNNEGYNARFTYPKGGAVEYVNSLLSRIDNNRIYYNEKIISIDLKKKNVTTNFRTLEYDRLISTMPLPKLLEVCKIPFNKNSFSWNKVLVFNLGFDKKGIDQKNHWVYFPEKEYIFYRIGYYDNIMGTDRLSLYVELGFNKNEVVNSDSLLDIVLADLKKAGIINQHILVSYVSILMDPAYVHINKDSEKEKLSKMKYLNENKIYSIGRYGGWKYCSIEDNIIEAKKLSEKLNY